MRIFADIQFSSPPTVLAAWPGMGNVGLIAMDYLRKSLHARAFAEIDMTPFFIPESIVVKDGIAQLPDIPSSIFSYTTHPNLIIFESNVQVGGQDGLTIIKTILDIVQQFGASRIFTAAAYAQTMSYQSDSQVLMACTSPALAQTIATQGLTPMPDGVIAGQNGLMLGVATTRNLEAACLLGTIPSYATNITYPKASLEIVKVLSTLLNLEVSTTELAAEVEQMNTQLASIEERIRQILPGSGDESAVGNEFEGVADEQVPHYIMDKIEKLFEQVLRDKSKASELKDELDRWNLFELYENRFLDIFDDHQSDSEP
jgi:proteasome assembly chaperone (PAC2) family protein